MDAGVRPSQAQAPALLSTLGGWANFVKSIRRAGGLWGGGGAGEVGGAKCPKPSQTPGALDPLDPNPLHSTPPPKWGGWQRGSAKGG